MSGVPTQTAMGRGGGLMCGSNAKVSGQSNAMGCLYASTTTSVEADDIHKHALTPIRITDTCTFLIHVKSGSQLDNQHLNPPSW